MRVRNVISVIVMVAIAIVLTHCNPPSQSTDLNYSSKEEMITSAKASIREINIDELKKMMDGGENYILVDVRTPGENEAGYISGAVNISRGFLELRIEDEGFWDDEGMYTPEKEDNVILYCRSGSRSALAAVTLQNMGFKNVSSLQGGFIAWREAFPELTNVIPSLDDSAADIPMETTDEEDAGGC